MKAVRVLLLLALVLVGAGVIYWKKSQPEIPVQRTFVNEDGKSLETTIIGKTGQVLHIERISDGARFELPLGKLGWKDRLFAERLPEQAPPAVVVKEAEKAEDPYLATRRQRIKVLEDKQKDFTDEIKSGSLGDILARKRQEDLIAVQQEIVELKAAIEAYQRRTKRE